MSANTFYLPANEVVHGTDAPVVAVKVGEVGFWPIYTRRSVDDLNGGPLPGDVAESALAASMFGWGTPIAGSAVKWADGKWGAA